MLRAPSLIRLLLALCLFAATFNHVRPILQHGLLWDYGYGDKAALVSKVYWDMLTILDPLAAILLLTKPRPGIWLTAVIIVSDVLHNSYYAAIGNHWFSTFFLAQVTFLVMVLCLGPIVLRSVPPRHRKP